MKVPLWASLRLLFGLGGAFVAALNPTTSPAVAGPAEAAGARRDAVPRAGSAGETDPTRQGET